MPSWIGWTSMLLASPSPAKATSVVLLTLGLAIVHLLCVARLREPQPHPSDPYPEILPGYSTLFRSVRRAAVPLLASLAVGFLASWLPWSLIPVWVVLGSSMTVLVAIDLFTTWLPHSMTLLCAGELVITIAIGLFLDPADLLHRLLWAGSGALAGYGFFFLIWRFGSGLGFGDVRLAGLLGAATAFTGLNTWWLTFLFGTTIGAVAAIAVSLYRRTRPHPLGTAFPYGPCLWSGAVFALILT